MEREFDLKSKVVRFFKEQFGAEAELSDWKPRGKGTHGAASRLKIATPEGEERLIMKSLYPSGFGHDYFSDRGGVLMLAFSNYNRMEKHVRGLRRGGRIPGYE